MCQCQSLEVHEIGASDGRILMSAHTTSSIEAFSTRCRLAGSASLMRERIFLDSVRYL